jgi:hypothetical protein
VPPLADAGCVGYRPASHEGGGRGCDAWNVARRPSQSDPSAPPRAIAGSAAGTCGKQFNERSGTLLNRTQYPSDVIALVVLWRLRYKLSLRDLPEMFAVRGIVFSHDST